MAKGANRKKTPRKANEVGKNATSVKKVDQQSSQDQIKPVVEKVALLNFDDYAAKVKAAANKRKNLTKYPDVLDDVDKLLNMKKRTDYDEYYQILDTISKNNGEIPFLKLSRNMNYDIIKDTHAVQFYKEPTPKQPGRTHTKLKSILKKRVCRCTKHQAKRRAEAFRKDNMRSNNNEYKPKIIKRVRFEPGTKPYDGELEDMLDKHLGHRNRQLIRASTYIDLQYYALIRKSPKMTIVEYMKDNPIKPY